MVLSCLFISTYLCCSFSVFKYILSSIPLLCLLFINICLSVCYTFVALWNHQCVLQMCYQNELIPCLMRHFLCLMRHFPCLLRHFPCLLRHFQRLLRHFPCFKILNDLNDLDLNDRKRPLSSWLFSEVSGRFLWLSLLIIIR